jgi:hypothetical protein
MVKPSTETVTFSVYYLNQTNKKHQEFCFFNFFGNAIIELIIQSSSVILVKKIEKYI